MRLLVLANRKAGGAADEPALTAALGALRAGAEVEVADTGDAGALARALDRRAARPVVVMGGDGSLHALVDALHRRGELDSCVIGLIPLGTGNDFARSAGIPLIPRQAADIVLAGHERAFDLVTDDAGGVVVNAAHLGVGADAARAAGALKARLGKVAYALGALVAGVRAPGWRLRVEVDGAVVADGRARLLMIALGNGATIGGGTPVAPDANPDDGRVDVVVSRAVGAIARMTFAVRIRTGAHVERADVTALRARTLAVRGPAVPLNVDGEVGEEITARTWIVQPHAWRLFAPPVP
jgi:YegS/Rv2252/BmrU family lipid kinase